MITFFGGIYFLFIKNFYFIFLHTSFKKKISCFANNIFEFEFLDREVELVQKTMYI